MVLTCVWRETGADTTPIITPVKCDIMVTVCDDIDIIDDIIDHLFGSMILVLILKQCHCHY